MEAIGDASAPAQSSNSSRKLQDVASQFEGLMFAEILKSAHMSSGLSPDGEDSGCEIARGMAEEQVARALASNGGMGLARLVMSGLAPKR